MSMQFSVRVPFTACSVFSYHTNKSRFKNRDFLADFYYHLTPRAVEEFPHHDLFSPTKLAMSNWINKRWHNGCLVSCDFQLLSGVRFIDMYDVPTRTPLETYKELIKECLGTPPHYDTPIYLCKVNPTMENMARQLLYYSGGTEEFVNPDYVRVYAVKLMDMTEGCNSVTIEREYFPVFNPD